MLVLSRKQNQTIVIDGQIEIEVLKIKGNTVRLGIRAPQDIKVLRGELSPFEIEATIVAKDSSIDVKSDSLHDASEGRRSYETIKIAQVV